MKNINVEQTNNRDVPRERRNILSMVLRLRWLRHLLNFLRFIAFQEKDPKHSLLELQPWHVLATFMFCYIAPYWVAINLLSLGIVWVFIGETMLTFAALEAIHVLCDR